MHRLQGCLHGNYILQVFERMTIPTQKLSNTLEFDSVDKQPDAAFGNFDNKTQIWWLFGDTH